jgi:hypothetical protein
LRGNGPPETQINGPAGIRDHLYPGLLSVKVAIKAAIDRAALRRADGIVRRVRLAEPLGIAACSPLRGVIQGERQRNGGYSS